MKIHLLTVPFFLFLFASGGQCQSCATLNPYIKTFNPALLLPSPAKLSSARCQLQWVTGTCCREDVLVSAVNSYNARSKDAIDKYLKFLDEIKEKTDRIEKKYTKDNGWTLDSSVFRLSPMTNVFSNILGKSFVNDQKININKCWAYVKRVREASLCNTCAADSPKYFDGEKAYIDGNDCKTMIGECQGYITFILQLVQSVRYIAENLSHLKGAQFDQMVLGINRVIPQVTSNKLINAITSGVPNTICDNLYTLNAPSFIDFINPFIEKYAAKTDDLLKGVRDFCANKRVCHLGSARSLFFGAPTTNWDDHSADLPRPFKADTTAVWSFMPPHKTRFNLTCAFFL